MMNTVRKWFDQPAVSPDTADVGSTLEQRMLASTVNGMLLIDAATFAIRWANPALAELLGFEPVELAAMPLPRLWSEESRFQDLRRAAAEARRAGRALGVETRLRRKGGTLVTVAMSLFLLEDGGSSCFLVTLEDRSLVKGLQDKVSEMDHFAAVGRLTAGVAHDLNNPLGAIRLHTELIEACLNDPATPESKVEILESLRTVDGCIDRMQKTILSLQEFTRSKTRQSQARDEDLGELLARVLLLYGKRLREERVEIGVAAEEGLPKVRVDGPQIQQVLVHLINNAVEAMASAPVKKLAVRIRREDGGIACAVEDTGPGIPVANADKVFQPFFSTKDAGKGLGMGLSMSQAIVTAQKGRISVENVPGGGARFVVWLPVAGTATAGDA